MTGETGSHLGEAKLSPIGGAPRIVVVEDEAIVAMDLEAMLNNMGFEVLETARTRREAIKHAREKAPDLVLMDIFLDDDGDGDGIEAAAWIRENLRIPHVYLSAHTDEKTLQRAAQTKPLGYIVKPFREHDVRCAVSIAIARAEATTESSRAVKAASWDALCAGALGVMQATTEIDALRIAVDSLGVSGSWELAHGFTIAKQADTSRLGPTEIWYERDPGRHAAFIADADALSFRARSSFQGPGREAEIPAEMPREADDPRLVPGRSATESGLMPSCIIPVSGPSGLLAVIETFGSASSRNHREWLDQANHIARVLARCIEVIRLQTRRSENLTAAESQLHGREAKLKQHDLFLSAAAHDLKSPLAALQLYLEQIGETTEQLGLPPAKSLKFRTPISRSIHLVERLSRGLDELLDFSRIDASRFELRREECCLNEIASDAIDALGESIDNAKCAIERNFGLSVTGSWDRARIGQAVYNLISNAIKFGPGEPIRISTERHDHEVRLTVRDFGIGIAVEYHKRIFELFDRGAAPDETKGWGLGLWIVKRIVEAHGGRLDVSSAAGRGASFSITLPREKTSTRFD